MAPVGVISLFGGAAEVSRHISHPPFDRELPSDKSLGPMLDQRDGGILDVVPLLGAPLGARWRSYVALHRCLSLFKADPRRRYA
jgi:hypothetical protein